MRCPHCNEGKLVPIPADDIWSPAHFQCDKCDSTYGQPSSLTLMKAPDGFALFQIGFEDEMAEERQLELGHAEWHEHYSPMDLSILKWQALADFYASKPNETVCDGGTGTCGLCLMHYLPNCNGCPVDALGYHKCNLTPYCKYHNLINDEHTDEELEAACREEVAFLERVKDGTQPHCGEDDGC